MVVRRRGSGTYVKGVSTNGGAIALGPSEGLSNIVGKENISSKIILFSIEKPSLEIAKKLEIDDEYIYRIIRTRHINNKPYSLEHTYMPLSIITGLEPKHLEGSIYNYIREELKLKTHSTHVWIRGDKANSEDTSLLKIPDNSFMMEIEKLAQLEDGRIFEYSITRHLHESFVFDQKLKSMNEFNEPAPDGYEWLLAKTKVKFTESATKDLSLYIDGIMNFEMVSENGDIYSGDILGTTDPEFSYEMYVGNEKEGYISGLVKKGEKAQLRYEEMLGGNVFLNLQ